MTTAMTSVFELFKIGIGPSSSHTVGPMVAARRFCLELEALGEPADVTRLTADLYGSLALTGIGHRTDRAIVAGWHGEEPESVAPDALDRLYEQVQHDRALSWLGRHRIAMDLERDLLWHRDEFLPQHSNAVRFTAYSGPAPRLVRTYFSIGGGFVAEESELATGQDATGAIQSPRFPFRSAAELLDLCHRHQLTMAQIVRANERTLRSEAQIDAGLDRIWHTMRECIRRGCHTVGVLPGGLGVQRRAPELYRRLGDHPSGPARSDPLTAMDWVDMCALAVNEENAAGGRVVTAPTNGAAGIIPAVLSFYEHFVPTAAPAGIREFLLTATAIGTLYKKNASLSAAEMGCQGEVGVACSMAAAGLAALLGGSPDQIENAAEMGMEHNLGLTCDPVAGLVQIPCIERNTMGAVKAINAARLAVFYGDGKHRVPLDRVIETMRQTGLDMQNKYKETSLGGLAVNVINC